MMLRPECDIREILYTNECPNIFVSTKLHEWISEYIHTNLFDTNECPNQYSYWKLHEYSNIFEYSSRFYTLTHSPTNVRIYSYKQIWHERMSEYIRKRKIDTNECPNIYSWPIYSNIWIYSSHSDLQFLRCLNKLYTHTVSYLTLRLTGMSILILHSGINYHPRYHLLCWHLFQKWNF